MKSQSIILLFVVLIVNNCSSPKSKPAEKAQVAKVAPLKVATTQQPNPITKLVDFEPHQLKTIKDHDYYPVHNNTLIVRTSPYLSNAFADDLTPDKDGITFVGSKYLEVLGIRKGDVFDYIDLSTGRPAVFVVGEGARVWLRKNHDPKKEYKYRGLNIIMDPKFQVDPQDVEGPDRITGLAVKNRAAPWWDKVMTPVWKESTVEATYHPAAVKLYHSSEGSNPQAHEAVVFDSKFHLVRFDEFTYLNWLQRNGRIGYLKADNLTSRPFQFDHFRGAIFGEFSQNFRLGALVPSSGPSCMELIDFYEEKKFPLKCSFMNKSPDDPNVSVNPLEPTDMSVDDLFLIDNGTLVLDENLELFKDYHYWKGDKIFELEVAKLSGVSIKEGDVFTYFYLDDGRMNKFIVGKRVKVKMMKSPQVGDDYTYRKFNIVLDEAAIKKEDEQDVDDITGLAVKGKEEFFVDGRTSQIKYSLTRENAESKKIIETVRMGNNLSLQQPDFEVHTFELGHAGGFPFYYFSVSPEANALFVKKDEKNFYAFPEPFKLLDYSYGHKKFHYGQWIKGSVLTILFPAVRMHGCHSLWVFWPDFSSEVYRFNCDSAGGC